MLVLTCEDCSLLCQFISASALQTLSFMSKIIIIFCFRYSFTVDHLFAPNINGLLARSFSRWMFFISMTSLAPRIVRRRCMIPSLMPLNTSVKMKATYSRVGTACRGSSISKCACSCLTRSKGVFKIISTFPCPL